jgi:hypothetical protein
MGALDRVLGFLDAQPWSVRSRFTVCRSGTGVTVQRGGMQASAREMGDGRVEVLYEHALHEATREHVSPEVASGLLLAVLQRERLCRVDVPNAEPLNGL